MHELVIAPHTQELSGEVLGFARFCAEGGHGTRALRPIGGTHWLRRGLGSRQEGQPSGQEDVLSGGRQARRLGSAGGAHNSEHGALSWRRWGQVRMGHGPCGIAQQQESTWRSFETVGPDAHDAVRTTHREPVGPGAHDVEGGEHDGHGQQA